MNSATATMAMIQIQFCDNQSMAIYAGRRRLGRSPEKNVMSFLGSGCLAHGWPNAYQLGLLVARLVAGALVPTNSLCGCAYTYRTVLVF